MNINDLRANAYTKNAGKPSSQGNSNTSNGSSAGKNIKPFVPVQLTKNDSQVSQNNQTPQGSFVQTNIVSMTNTKKQIFRKAKSPKKLTMITTIFSLRFLLPVQQKTVRNRYTDELQSF